MKKLFLLIGFFLLVPTIVQATLPISPPWIEGYWEEQEVFLPDNFSAGWILIPTYLPTALQNTSLIDNRGKPVPFFKVILSPEQKDQYNFIKNSEVQTDSINFVWSYREYDKEDWKSLDINVFDPSWQRLTPSFRMDFMGAPDLGQPIYLEYLKVNPEFVSEALQIIDLKTTPGFLSLSYPNGFWPNLVVKNFKSEEYVNSQSLQKGAGKIHVYKSYFLFEAQRGKSYRLTNDREVVSLNPEEPTETLIFNKIPQARLGEIEGKEKINWIVFALTTKFLHFFVGVLFLASFLLIIMHLRKKRRTSI